MDAQQSAVPVMVLVLWPLAQTASTQLEFDEFNDPTATQTECLNTHWDEGEKHMRRKLPELT